MSRQRSDLEAMFDTLWRILGGPPLESEYQFTANRAWRFDRACPGRRVAIELEGGVYSGGRHVRGRGYEDDCEKYNAGKLLGWNVQRFTRGMLERDPYGHLTPVVRLVLHGEAYPDDKQAPEEG